MPEAFVRKLRTKRGGTGKLWARPDIIACLGAFSFIPRRKETFFFAYSVGGVSPNMDETRGAFDFFHAGGAPQLKIHTNGYVTQIEKCEEDCGSDHVQMI